LANIKFWQVPKLACSGFLPQVANRAKVASRFKVSILAIMANGAFWTCPELAYTLMIVILLHC